MRTHGRGKGGRARKAIGRGARKGGKALRRLVPFGKVSARKSLPERMRETLRNVGENGSEILSSLQERVPAGARRARDWASEKISEHPLAVSTGALAAGVAAASLVPLSDQEREGLSRAGRKLRALTDGGKVRALAQLLHAREALRHRLEGAEPQESIGRTVRKARPTKREAPQAQRLGKAATKRPGQGTTRRKPQRGS